VATSHLRAITGSESQAFATAPSSAFQAADQEAGPAVEGGIQAAVAVVDDWLTEMKRAIARADAPSTTNARLSKVELRLTNLEGERKALRNATTEERDRWARYLVELAGDDSMPSPQRSAAIDVWQRIIEREPSVMYPTCGKDEEDLTFYFSWGGRSRSMEIQVDTSGGISWFYRDHVVNVSLSSDNQPADAFLTFVPLFVRSAR